MPIRNHGPCQKQVKLKYSTFPRCRRLGTVTLSAVTFFVSIIYYLLSTIYAPLSIYLYNYLLLSTDIVSTKLNTKVMEMENIIK